MNEIDVKGQRDLAEDLGTPEVEEFDVTELARKSPLLTRLVEEVRNEKVDGPHVYDRMHNRHNRSR